MKKSIFVSLLLISILTGWACTIGIINGSATTDGRPILWKSRGAGSNVQVFHEDQYTYQYVGSGNGGSEYAWMGMNEAGFAIANAMVGDLDRLPGNGDCMLQALRNYSTIDEFLVFLDSTNVTGRETHTCYVAFDATGTAVVIEAGSNEYWVYNTEDSEYGFMTRTSFSYAGSGPPGSDDMMTTVLTELAQEGPISWQDIFPYIIRGYYYNEYDPVPIPYPDYWNMNLPYGYVTSDYSNNMTGFTSVALMQGALPEEEPWLSTMWTALGPPTCGIATPFWAVCPEIPSVAVANPQTPLNQRILEVIDMVHNLSSSDAADTYMLSNEDNLGYWDTLVPFETEKFELLDFLRESWQNSPPSVNELQSYQNMIANEAYETIMGWNYQPELRADFASDHVHGDIPFTVHFESTTLHAPDSLNWDLNGDGETDFIQTSDFAAGLDFTYIEAGSYTVTLIATKDTETDTLVIENYITASLPNTDYLVASVDTVICDLEEPFEQEVYLYNIGDYPVIIEDYLFTELPDYPSPQPFLFDCYFGEMWGFLPRTIDPGDSLLMFVMPFMPVREFWGETLVLMADLDTLMIPCLYDEELWQNAEDIDIAKNSYLGNYPNPFNPQTTISWSNSDSGKSSSIIIFNLRGQMIRQYDALPDRGNLVWKGKDDSGRSVASGIYFYQLYSGENLISSKRLLLLK